jgi:glycosyltransferase involved in cell wall biosynthesis
MTIEGIRDWKHALEFVKLLRDEQIDVVHAHMIRAALVAVPLAKIARVPVIVHTCHGREAWRTSWLKRQFWLDRRLSDLADATLAVSEATRTYLINDKQLRPEDVRVIRNGRNLDVCTLSHNEKQRVQAEFGLATNELVVGVFGRLESQKGLSYLLHALPTVRQRVGAFKVLFVGDGSLRHELEKQSQALGLRETIIFTGYRNDAKQLMAFCDLVVLPSLYEGMPLVPIEAAILGKPVVATAVDGTTEVVANASTGVLVPPRDPILLAQAITELLLNPQLRRDMGTRARQRAEILFSLGRQISETEALYVSLLQTRQARRRPANTHRAAFANAPRQSQ